MTGTPAIHFLERLLPPQSGRAAQPADAPAAREFAELMSRLFYSNMPIAAIARGAEIPDTTAPLPAVDKAERQDPAEETPRTDRRVEEETGQQQRIATVEYPNRVPAEPAEVSAPVDGGRSTGPADSIAAPAFPLPQPRTASSAAPPVQQPMDRPFAQGAPPVIQGKGSEAPQVAPQEARPVQSGSGAFPKIQIEGGASDQLPRHGHMLSGRTVPIAQSEGGHPVLSKEAPAAPRGGAAEQQTASFIGSAAQTPSAAAQKHKGQSRTATPGAGQTAGAARSEQQPSNPQTPQAVAAPAASQPGVNNALTAGFNGTGQSGSLPPSAARSEALPLAGAFGNLSQQAGLRPAAPAAAAKPRIPVPPRFIADQVAVQIKKSLGSGNDRISIQLKPAELGKVDVRLEVGSEGRVTAVITADRADTLDLLQRDARILQSSLQDAGLRTDSNSLSFELRHNGQAHDQARDEPGRAGGTSNTGVDAANAPDTTPQMTRPAIVADDRVDIHV